jgi:hypothetical protein
MPIIRKTIKPQEKPKAGSTLYHLHLKVTNTAIPFKVDYYFGSIASIYEAFTAAHLGIAQQSLYDYGITPEKPYENKICTISKSEIKRKKGGRRKPKTI